MFGADVFILELGGLGLRGVERFSQVAPGVGIATALHLVAAGDFGLQIRFEPGRGHTDAFQQVGDETLSLVNEGEGEMFAVNFLVRMLAGEALRRLRPRRFCRDTRRARWGWCGFWRAGPLGRKYQS